MNRKGIGTCEIRGTGYLLAGTDKSQDFYSPDNRRGETDRAAKVRKHG
jgi:hypothetical protein